MDEMAIKIGIDKLNNRTYGFVNVGDCLPPDPEIYGKEKANQAFVLMLICLNQSWRIPIAYVLVNKLEAHKKKL